MWKEYKELYVDAYYTLKAKWCECAAITALFLIFGGVVKFAAHWILPYFYTFLLEATVMGATRYCLQIAKEKDEQLKDFLFAFSSFRNILLLLFIGIVGAPALLLGFALCILPGIYILLLLATVHFMAADQSKADFCSLWQQSVTILEGNVWKYCTLKLQLLVVTVLGSLVTLGIGTFWVVPYAWNVQATFYLKLRQQKEAYIAADNSEEP